MSGATVKKNVLEITDDYDGFVKRTGLLWSPFQVAALGIPSDDFDSTFWEKSVSMLLQFCAANRRYHIVSVSCGRFENRYVPGRNIYMLAEGDDQQDLVLDMCLKKDKNLLMEEMLEETLAMHRSIDRGDETK